MVIIFSCGAIHASAEESASAIDSQPAPDMRAPTDAMSAHLQIETQTDCLSSPSLRDNLEAVLRPYDDASLLSIAVVDAPAVSGSAVTLRVMMIETGEIVLERHFTFNRADCRSAHQVLGVVLEQFVADFPIAKWKAENPPSETAPPPPVRIETVEVSQCAMTAAFRASAALVARFPALSGALEIGAGPDVGTHRHGLAGKAVARVGYPHDLENGRYMETFALLALGWRGRLSGRFEMRVFLRTGGLYLRGFGFDENLSRWLPWVDAQVILARQVGRSSLGIDFGGSPLRYSVSIVDSHKRDLPFLHLGLYWSFSVLRMI